MSSCVTLQIHQSQFPESVKRELLHSLRSRQVNHKFHYDSVKQTNQWLALHEAHSPARTDQDCLDTYDRAFKAAAARIAGRRVHVVGLGCGGGQKDTRLLKLLRANRRELFYTPSDVSVAMTLVAREAAVKILPEENCQPLVCDLALADDLQGVLASRITHRTSRIITFFGMIPNFEPQVILPRLASLTQSGDWLLFSANLAPGNDCSAGMRKIMPQYDNPLTRDWLMTFLHDLGVAGSDGTLLFAIETGGHGLRRIVARFNFKRGQTVRVEGRLFRFKRGESIRLFFSYRYTPQKVEQLLARHGISVRDQWVTRSGEEGVFLCRRGREPQKSR